MIRALALIFMTLFAMITTLTMTSTSYAADLDRASEKFIQVSNGLKIFVRHTPAAAGQPTLVVLNGLTHSTENWDKFFRELKLYGEGLLRIDLAGQGRTLSQNGAVLDVIRYQDQANYVLEVLAALNITEKVDLIGLSYGGGIATYLAEKNPSKVLRLIAISPYNEPQPEQDKWVQQQVALNRAEFPYNPASDDELYDYFLRQLVYSTFPAADSTLLTTPYKLEAVYRMSQGIRKLRTAHHASTLPPKSVFLIGGSIDQVVHPWELDNLWASIPESAKASRLVLTGVDHDIIDLEPKAAAHWVQLILANDPQTLSGDTITIEP